MRALIERVTSGAFRTQTEKCQEGPVEGPKDNFRYGVMQLWLEIIEAFAIPNYESPRIFFLA